MVVLKTRPGKGTRWVKDIKRERSFNTLRENILAVRDVVAENQKEARTSKITMGKWTGSALRSIVHTLPDRDQWFR